MRKYDGRHAYVYHIAIKRATHGSDSLMETVSFYIIVVAILLFIVTFFAINRFVTRFIMIHVKDVYKRQDTRRVYMQATDIGHIGVFYDEDRFFYDNVKTGDIFMFNGIEGGWRVINPPGRFRLIGVDMDKTIYIARVDEDNNALTVYTGKLGVGFKPVYKYNHPTTFNELTLSDVKTIIKDGSDETTKVTDCLLYTSCESIPRVSS